MKFFPSRLVRSVAAAFVFSLAIVGGLFAAAPKFAQETSDLAPDPTVKFGVLPNGLRYAVVSNKEPKGRASLRLLVKSGSLNETDEQQGLAHFLEHMAFNGSEHYKPGTLVEFFQRMGMSFGGDTNAFTSFDRTQYMLELANTEEATLAEGLQVFSDYAGGLLLLNDEIDKERGIILSEKRARDSVAFRTFVAEFKFVLDGSLLPKRLPIGEADVIKNAPRERFVDYYNAWYRPDLITVVAVGDFDAASVEKQIVAAFSGLASRAPERAKPDLGKLAPAPGVRTYFHSETEAPTTEVSIETIVPIGHEQDNAANRLKRVPRDLANAIINRRFSVLAKKEGAPFSNARSSVNEMFDYVREASVSLTCKADQWQAALALGEQELRKALDYGFQPYELQEVVATYLQRLELEVKAAPTRRSPDVANEIAQSVNDDEVFTSAEADLALLKPALQKITPEDCLAALREAWKTDHRYVLVTGNATLGASAESDIKAVYEKSHATPVAAPAKEAAAVWGYTDFGPAGKVAKRERVEDLDITLVTFENGVRLNIKKTNFEAGTISLLARVGEGSKTEPTGKQGFAQFATATFDLGGLGRHNVDDLRRILAGKTVELRFGASADAFEFGGRTTPADLLLELQLLAAKITDAGYRPEAQRLTRKGIEQMYIGFQHTPNGPMALEIANLLASGDSRFGLPAKEALLSYTMEDAKAWLLPALATGSIELGIAGDLDVEKTIEAVSQTLGALSRREARKDDPKLLVVKFPAQPFAKSYTIDSQIPKGLAAFYWPTTDGLDAHVGRRLNMLSAIFTDRLRIKIREEMGGTYSPRSRSFASDVFPGYGYLNANIDVDPAMADKIKAAVDAISIDLAKNGVSEDELVRAKQPIITSLKESARTNGYWLASVLGKAQENPKVLDWARDRESDYNAITKVEMDQYARTYLPAEKISHAIILPAKKEVPAPTPTEAPKAP